MKTILVRAIWIFLGWILGSFFPISPMPPVEEQCHRLEIARKNDLCRDNIVMPSWFYDGGDLGIGCAETEEQAREIAEQLGAPVHFEKK